MSLNYKRIQKHTGTFLQLTGTTLEEFQTIVGQVQPLWEAREAKKKHHGRTPQLATLEDQILCVLVYYRTYVTHTFLGFLFGLHNANICRLLKRIEPWMAKKITIKKDRSLTPEKILKILADVTEQPTQRPKKKQKKAYSGKKKQHTLKQEILMTEKGKILCVSKTYGGKTHDFRIRKQERLLPLSSLKYADSGYQGWQKLQALVTLPFKRSKKKPLTSEQKQHNRALASFRIRVEHKIRELKIFKILKETYRNFQKKHHLRSQIIAGIVNLKHGF